MNPEDRQPIRSAWPSVQYGKPLTDKKIEEYRKRGYYSAELREARRQWRNRKKSNREGNFIRTGDGLIYSPL